MSMGTAMLVIKKGRISARLSVLKMEWPDTGTVMDSRGLEEKSIT